MPALAFLGRSPAGLSLLLGSFKRSKHMNRPMTGCPSAENRSSHYPLKNFARLRRSQTNLGISKAHATVEDLPIAGNDKRIGALPAHHGLLLTVEADVSSRW